MAESVRSHAGAGLWGYEHIHVGTPKALAKCADKNKWSATFMHKLVKCVPRLAEGSSLSVKGGLRGRQKHRDKGRRE